MRKENHYKMAADIPAGNIGYHIVYDLPLAVNRELEPHEMTNQQIFNRFADVLSRRGEKLILNELAYLKLGDEEKEALADATIVLNNRGYRW